MIYHAEGFYGMKDYAKLCGVSPRNIRDRIRARTIRYVEIDGFYLVNAILSPPVKSMKRPRPMPVSVTAAESFSFDGLREVGSFSRGKHFTEGIFYEAILTGKLDGYVIGDKVFLQPVSAEQFYKSR